MTTKYTQQDLDILIAARNRIKPIAHWCQNTMAKAADGRHVFTDSPDAVQWCAMGALRREIGYATIGSEENCNLINHNFRLQTLLNKFGDVVELNDFPKFPGCEGIYKAHDAVCGVYEQAIEFVRKEISAT